MINKNFWKNKKVLITGHTGFKGFWMFLLLKKIGSDVYGVSIEKNSSEIFIIIFKDNRQKRWKHRIF